MRVIARSAMLTDRMGRNNKARHPGSGTLRAGRGEHFLSQVAGLYLSRIEESATNRLAVGWSPTRPATSIGPVSSANYRRGLVLEPKPEDRVATPAVIVAHRLEESQAQNDVPQLPSHNG